MTEFFRQVLDVAVPIFAITSMFSVGLGNSLGTLVAPLRRIRLVALVLAANFVLVPLLAWVVAQLFSLGYALEAGLILVAVSAGAPFLLKFAQIAGGSVPLAASLLVLLVVVTVVYVPLALPLFVSGASVGVLPVAVSLGWTMLAPVAIGIAIRQFSAHRAEQLRPYAARIVTPVFAVVLVSTFLANAHHITTVGASGVGAGLVLIAGALSIGLLVGPSAWETRSVIGLATAQRNIAAATVIATQEFDDPNVLVMVVVTALVAMAILFPTAIILGWRSGLRKHSAPLQRRRVIRT